MAIGDTGGNGGLTIASSATAAGSIHFAKGSAGTDQYRGYLNYVHSTDIMNFGTSGAGRMDLSVTGLNVVGDVKASGAFTRTAYNSGYLEGGYNNIGASSTDTGPIYTIGSAYQPAATTLGIMYGIGYAHTNASFINFTGQSGWGMYVASAGLAKVWLGSDNGVISSTGQHYVGANVVWNAGNDGTGSGLDADLLDGVQGSSYLQSGGSSYTINTPTSAAFGGGSALQIYQPTAGTAAQMVFHVGGDFAGYFGLDGAINDFAIGGWSYGASAKYKVWHAGNDGAGSGLDADLLDGIAGGNFNRGDSVYGSMPGVSGWDMNTVFTTRNRSGFIDAWSGTNFPSGTTHVQGIQVRHNSGNHYGFQLVNQYNQDKIWHRRVTNSSFAGWSQVWTSSTDGAGSGLDADLLDGVQASGFLSSSSAATQNHYIRNGSPTVYFRDTNHRSAMLHVNAEIIYFLSGSAADSNVWSTMSNGRWPMQLNTTTGTMTVGGNVTANSDIRLKENIRPIGNSMAMFDQIDAKRFDWKKGEKVGDLGFIAQDVRAAGLEEVVVESENRDLDTKELIGTTLTLDYSRMVSVLWDVVKELKTEIEDLKIQIGE